MTRKISNLALKEYECPRKCQQDDYPNNNSECEVDELRFAFCSYVNQDNFLVISYFI